MAEGMGGWRQCQSDTEPEEVEEAEDAEDEAEDQGEHQMKKKRGGEKDAKNIFSFRIPVISSN